jgi:phage head maturation protease
LMRATPAALARVAVIATSAIARVRLSFNVCRVATRITLITTLLKISVTGMPAMDAVSVTHR